jgi:hypothetical protein
MRRDDSLFGPDRGTRPFSRLLRKRRLLSTTQFTGAKRTIPLEEITFDPGRDHRFDAIPFHTATKVGPEGVKLRLVLRIRGWAVIRADLVFAGALWGSWP